MPQNFEKRSRYKYPFSVTIADDMKESSAQCKHLFASFMNESEVTVDQLGRGLWVKLVHKSEWVAFAQCVRFAQCMSPLNSKTDIMT